VFDWVFENVHRSSRTDGYCGLGHSAGASAMAYALSFYGLGDTFDFVIMNSGPPVGRIDYGCEPDLYTGASRYLCPMIPDAPIAYEANRAVEINPVEATTTCGEPYDDPSLADIARWEADSIVSPGGVYDFPDTPISFYYCATEPNSAVGLGSFYADSVTSSRTVNCVAGLCEGEGTFRDPDAFEQMVLDLETSCTPRHLTTP
jgi:hypothetical protein